MNKDRAESLSDGVFAIVMTLLVFNLKVPISQGILTNQQLWVQVSALWPFVASCALTFLVVAVFWINHNFLFHSYIKEYDRKLNLLNILYLLFLVFVPFSANLVGTYPHNALPVVLYGINILAVLGMSDAMVRYLRKHKEMRKELSARTIKQARIRTTLSESSYILGIISSFFFIPISVFFYLFPLIFNIIPGTLNLVEKLFKFEIA